MMAEGDLRALVRETLREVLGRAGAAPAGAQGSAAAAAGAAAAPLAAPLTETVRIACDADLQAFLARLVAPGGIEAVRAGRLAFRLAAAAESAAPAAAAAAAGAAPMLEGVISERRLAGLAPGSRLRLAPGAVLTPLARDRARALGLTVEREEA